MGAYAFGSCTWWSFNTLVFVLGTLIFNVKVGLVAAAGVIVFFIVTSMMEKNHQLMQTR